jgi:aminoglycoside 3-N-acetyltransferase I
VETLIRRLQPQDSETAHALVNAFHRRVVSPEYLSRILADSVNVLMVAERNTEVVGYVWAHWLDRLKIERRHLFIYEIEVAPPYRRKGIGSNLMRAVFSNARSEGADIFVFTNHSNDAAVSF